MKEPERLVDAGYKEEELAGIRKADVEEMVEACRPILEHYGERPEEVVEDLVASLREFLEYWHSKTFGTL
jgi:hypothetical protein